MSAAKIPVTLDPYALEVVLKAAELAADQLLVQVAEEDGGPQRIALAAEFSLAVADLLTDLDEARLAQ